MGARLFLKSMSSVFLAIVLLANLLLFFNLAGLVGRPIIQDTSTQYFGFSSLLDFIELFGHSSALNGVYQFMNNVVADAQMNLTGRWTAFANSGGVYDLPSFFTAIGNFFLNIFALLEYAFYPILFVVYIAMLIAFLFGAIMNLFLGLYNTPVPPNPYDSMNLVHMMLMAFPF